MSPLVDRSEQNGRSAARRLGRRLPVRASAALLLLLAALLALPAVWGLPAANDGTTMVAAPDAAALGARPSAGKGGDGNGKGDARADREDESGKREGAANDGRKRPSGERVGIAAIHRDLASRTVAEVCGDAEGMIVNGVPVCTHGADPAPPGFDPARSVAPAGRKRAAATVACVGDGVSGPRIEVLYVYPQGGNRFDEYAESFRGWVADMDQVFQRSAAISGGDRRLRLVTDDGCRPVVTPVGISTTAIKSFGATIDAVIDQGFDRRDRNYLMFVDARNYCGIGTIRGDDSPDQANYNNTGGGYSRVDAGCWGGVTAAHEVMHNLGGVQMSAPNTSEGWHCTDERDVMCYSDSPKYPKMRSVCTDGPWASLALFDCGQDDYYTTDPAPGSYLDTHWNAADSRFLFDPSTEPGPNDEPVLRVSAAEGTVGQQLSVTVAGFPAGEALSVTFAGDEVATGNVGADGSTRLSVVVPARPADDYEVTATAGSDSETAAFRVVPGLDAVRTSGRLVVAEFTGFGAGESVTVRFGSAAPQTVTADADGGGRAEFTAPRKAKGKRTVTAVGADGHEATDTVSLGASARKKGGKHGRARGDETLQPAEADGGDRDSAGRNRSGSGSGEDDAGRSRNGR